MNIKKTTKKQKLELIDKLKEAKLKRCFSRGGNALDDCEGAGPGAFRLGSAWVPPGFRLGSAWVPTGVRLGSELHRAHETLHRFLGNIGNRG